MTSASLRYPKPKVDRARRRSREEGRERKRFFLPGVPYRAIIIVVVIFLFFFFFFSILPNRGGESGETGTVYLNERCASPLLFRFPFVPRFENRLRKSTRLPTASNFRLEDSTSAKKKFDPNSLKRVSSSLCNSFFFLFFFLNTAKFWKLETLRVLLVELEVGINVRSRIKIRCCKSSQIPSSNRHLVVLLKSR